MENLGLNPPPAQPSPSFWAGKRVLVTGHSGFKGGWLTLWLAKMGAEVTGISLPPQTAPNLYTLADVANACESRFVDIRDGRALAPVFQSAKPEVVFHLAAQPLVRASYQSPVETFSTNVMGTVHVLQAIREAGSVRAAVMVTTDKVYRNRDWAWPYREGDALGGHDPYSASKAASEIAIECWRQSFLADAGTAVASARAGNVIGGGDWSADRLLPDAVRAWRAGNVLEVRRPQAVRPWQHVLEPLAGYLVLAQRLWTDIAAAKPYNFGPTSGEAATVQHVIELARKAYGSGRVTYATIQEGPHEAHLLALETARARSALGVAPRWQLADAVSRTMHWYREQAEGTPAHELCLQDLAAFLGRP